MESKELGNMEEWKNRMQQEITELKSKNMHLESEQGTMKKDIQALQTSEKLQDIKISAIESTLSEIKEDTNWIRRKITGALITAIITAVVAGIIGIAIANIFKGGQ